MKRPEKTFLTDIFNYSSGVAHGWNQACDAWEKFLPELLEACQMAKKFIEYARYVLDDGKATIGSQFPKKEDADIEIERLQQTITKLKVKNEVNK